MPSQFSRTQVGLLVLRYVVGDGHASLLACVFLGNLVFLCVVPLILGPTANLGASHLCLGSPYRILQQPSYLSRPACAPGHIKQAVDGAKDSHRKHGLAVRWVAAWIAAKHGSIVAAGKCWIWGSRGNPRLQRNLIRDVVCMCCIPPSEVSFLRFNLVLAHVVNHTTGCSPADQKVAAAAVSVTLATTRGGSGI
jgi:hypothetical protein